MRGLFNKIFFNSPQRCVFKVLTRNFQHITYYSSAISNNKYNQKVLFNTFDKLLHRKPEKCYPTTSSRTELVNNFGDFFSNKIAVLRNELANIYTAISIKVVHEQSGKVEYERERLLGIANKLMNFQNDSQQPFALVFDFSALLVDNLN